MHYGGLYQKKPQPQRPAELYCGLGSHHILQNSEFSTQAAENASNLEHYGYLGFRKYCSYLKRVILPTIWGKRNWLRDLLRDAKLAVFPHTGHELLITGFLVYASLANAST